MQKLVIYLLLSLYLLPASARIEELNRVVAVVNDDVITLLELERRVRTIEKQLLQSNTPLPPHQVLQKQVLERLIVEQLQLARAKMSGIRVNDEALNKVISNIAAKNNLSLEQFRTVLEGDGIDFAGFREQIRDEVIITRLRTRLVNNRVSISEQEIDAYLATRGDTGDKNVQYRLSHILVAVPEAASPEQVQAARARAQKILERLKEGGDFTQMAISESDGQQALKGGDLGWRRSEELPTLFADSVVNMAPGELSPLIRSTSGFHILKVEQKRGGERHITRQTHARHILIRTNAIVSDTDARNQLRRLRERISNGEDFARLARIHSEDPGSGAKGGDLGWASPGQFVAAFEETMNRLQIGEISEPFKSQFGWHIMQVLERRNQDETEQFNRNRARQVLRQRKIEEETELWLRRLRDEAYVEYRLEG